MEDSSCPICGLAEETLGHVLWNCSAAQDVWSQTSKPIQKLSLEAKSLKEIWQQIMGKLLKTMMEEVGSIMRLIWTRRNEVVHGKEFRHPNSIIHKAQDDLKCFKTARQNNSNGQGSMFSGRNQRWTTPPEGIYKLNWDAAINQSLGLMGIGPILRNYNGQVLGTIRARRNINLSPFIAEAYAMMMDVLFYKEASFHSVIFEGDSLQVVERMQKTVIDWSQGGFIIKDTKQVLQEFVSWSFCHTKRDSNMAAHMLAKDALPIECDL
ncbi:uncharacterized protein LOC122309093 [Carya illinoinensis]|uniref:uncharacterized protein LOC122309093 n=1 Tax=Carya illinoinensis TaxID=32201 RepID=UPI001C71EF3D|nr:uncharacterized protein LOC122309093 [Carya illinoinensis]